MITSGKTKIGTKTLRRVSPDLCAEDSREVKALSGPHDQREVRQALDELMRAFEAFKEANEERLARIDRRLEADVVTEEKVHRMNDALDRQQKMLDEFALEQRRPVLDYAGGEEDREHKRAFDEYIRKGVSAGLDEVESKSSFTSLSTGANSAGYIVPESVMVAVNERLLTASPMRRLASVQEVSTTNFKKLLTASGPGVVWGASETVDKTGDFSDGAFSERSFKFGRLVAMPAATQMLLDDAAVDLERWLADEIYIGFADKESEAFVKGPGVSPPSPKGFLRETTARQADNLANDRIGYIASGVRQNWPSSAASRTQKLLDVVYALKASYRANARWLMNKTSIAAIRTWVDANNNPLWQPPVSPGAPATLLDYPVVEVEEMPNKNTSGLEYPLAFGDWSRGYLIADRMDMRILRDPYSKKPNVLFYTTKTIGGGVMDHAAIKLMKCATS